MTTPHHTGDTVRRIVEEVLQRIAAEAAAVPRPAAAAPVHPASPVARVATAAAVVPAGGISIAERVVTLESIARLPAGTRQVKVPARAVITPSARDHARAVGISIVSDTASKPPASPASLPFAIGHADCTGDVTRKSAAIARAVPVAQQVPPSGLVDVVAALAAHVARDGGRGVLLTGRPAVAAALANRHPGVRAVTGRDAATVSRATAECSANLLVVDPRDFGGGLERACTDFATRDRPAVPPELAAAPAPAATACSCKTHAH